MKRAMKFLILLGLVFGIAMVSAEIDTEIANELMGLEPSSLDNPPHLAKPDIIGEDKSKSSSFWQDIPFLERFMSSLFPSYTKSSRRASYYYHTTTGMPLIIWRFRFYQIGNNSSEVLAATTEGATDSGDQVKTIGSTSLPPVSTDKISKTGRRRRNKEHKVGQLAKRLSLPSYMNIDDLDKYDIEGKNLFKKLKFKNGKKVRSITGIGHNFNKSSNSSAKSCYRRIYTYVVSTDWMAIVVHIAVVLVFILVLSLLLVICQATMNTIEVKQAKNIAKKFKPKGFQVYTVV